MWLVFAGDGAHGDGDAVPRIDGSDSVGEIDKFVFGEFLARGFEEVIGSVVLGDQREGFCPGQSGTFAREWIEENKTGRKYFSRMQEEEAKHPIEEVGARLRAAMPFLDPVTVKDNTPQTEVATA